MGEGRLTFWLKIISEHELKKFIMMWTDKSFNVNNATFCKKLMINFGCMMTLTISMQCSTVNKHYVSSEDISLKGVYSTPNPLTRKENRNIHSVSVQKEAIVHLMQACGSSIREEYGSLFTVAHRTHTQGSRVRLLSIYMLCKQSHVRSSSTNTISLICICQICQKWKNDSIIYLLLVFS